MGVTTGRQLGCTYRCSAHLLRCACEGWDGTPRVQIDNRTWARHRDHTAGGRLRKTGEGGVVRLAGSASAASSFTCTVDGLDHLVSDDAAVRGIAARQGTYTAMCGHVVYVAALVSCAGPLCPRCAQLAHEVQPPASVPLDRDSGRGRARLARLIGLLSPHSF
jgi:hypothetical protein